MATTSQQGLVGQLGKPFAERFSLVSSPLRGIDRELPRRNVCQKTMAAEPQRRCAGQLLQKSTNRRTNPARSSAASVSLS